MEDIAKILEILKPAHQKPAAPVRKRPEKSGPVEVTLIIEPPLATCGDCRFTSTISGRWSVEDGQLIWRTDPEFQPGRGPDLLGCCESSVAKFTSLTVTQTDGSEWKEEVISENDFKALKKAQIDAEARYEG